MVNSDFSHRPSCHLWTKIIYFFHPNLCTFISFSCFIALARTFNSHSFPHWASSNSSEFRFSNPRNVLYHYFSSGYIHWILHLILASIFWYVNCSSIKLILKKKTVTEMWRKHKWKRNCQVTLSYIIY